MIDHQAERDNIETVVDQLDEGYYSDSTHDEVQRASDYLLALFNERESDGDERTRRDPRFYGWSAFEREH